MRDENRVNIFSFLFNLLAQFFGLFHLGLGLALDDHGVYHHHTDQRQYQHKHKREQD